MAENIELNDINKEDEDYQEEQEETSFIEENNRPDYENMVIIDSSIPNVRRDAGVMRRAYTKDKKDFLKKELGVKINKNYGPSSSYLFDKMEITMNKDRTKINGANYNGVKVLVLRNGKIEYSTDITKQRAVNEFKELIRKAEEEYAKSAKGDVEKMLAEQIGDDLEEETAEEVIDRAYERLQEEIKERRDEIVAGLNENELREFRGLLRVKNLEFLDTEIQHWKDLAKTESDQARKKLYEAISEVAELKADEIRLRNNQIPKSARVQEIIQDEIRINDLTRLQRFKKWAKENLTGLSAVAISIAGIITTIVVAGEKLLEWEQKALNRLQKH